MSTQIFKDIAFVIYPVRDTKAAREFYEGTLGLAVTANWEDKWVEYDIGNGTLAITTANELHHAGTHGVAVGLEVTDFDSVVAALKQKGVAVVEGPFDSPVCRGCLIRDPDGNDIVLHQRK